LKPDIDILIVQLRDGRPATRTEAARTLSEHPSSLARKDLIRCLDDPHENVRYWATWALAVLGGGDALDRVAGQLGDADAGVRMIAAKALTTHSHPRAAVHLMRVLDDPSDNVSYWARAALAELGTQVLGRLISLLGDESWRRRQAAAETIIRLGLQGVETVVRSLNRSDANVQYWVLHILGELRDRRAAPFVIPFLSNPRRDLVIQAATAIGKMGAREGIARLVALLGNRDESVRLAAIEALSGFGDYSVKVLTDLLASNRRVMKVSATVSLAMVGDTALRHILDKLRDESSELRFWAIRALERFDNPAIIPVLVDLLDDEEFDIQLAAVTALENYELSPGVAESLVSRLGSPHWRVRRALAETLAAQRHLPPHLFARGLEHEHEDVRYWTAWVLGHLENEQAVHMLVERFSDPAWPIRRRAAESISEIGFVAVPALVALLQDSSTDANVRYWASRAVVGITDVELLSTLIDLLEDSDWSIRANAEEALLCFGGEAVAALLTALRLKSSRVLRENVSRCLIAMKEVPCESVVRLFEFRDPDLNYWTSTILAGRGRESLEPLEALLRRGEERTRYLTLQTMGAIDEPEVHQRCIELLEDEYPSIRRVAAEVLGRWRVADAVEPLLVATEDASDELRMVIIEALGRIADERALPLLFEGLAHERWDVRKEAIVALGRLASPEACGALVAVLNDAESSDFHPFVARALGAIGGQEAFLALVASLGSSKVEDTRIAAIDALGCHKNPKAYEHLLPLLEDKGWVVRKAALEAIGELEGIRDLEPLKTIVRSSDPLLRSIAQRVLRQQMGEKRWQNYVDLTVHRALLEPAELHYRNGLELRTAGDFKGAAREARAAIRCARRSHYYTLLGTIHLETRRLDLALKNLESAHSLSVSDPVILSKLAAVHMLARRPRKAERLFMRILELADVDDALRNVAERTLERIRAGC